MLTIIWLLEVSGSYNKYKMAKLLEQQIVPISDDLKEILRSHIKSKNLSIGDCLFHLEKIKLYRSPILAKRFHKRLKKFMG